ncbi:hypothetical protein L2E82_02807 [Cichorium intybus]|uniref:Uncharacterized protein n=1 Tax=Cichorium intybus TaxID=13427 RepID=A0ACB9H2C6_CICIN|nr:hypothetical protein L2E82_02807 [Cichorium intybus]
MDKLNDVNHLDWLRSLRIVLEFEDNLYAIKEPIPKAHSTGAIRAIRNEYENRLNECDEVRCMSPIWPYMDQPTQLLLNCSLRNEVSRRKDQDEKQGQF